MHRKNGRRKKEKTITIIMHGFGEIYVAFVSLLKTATQCLSYAFNMSAITELKKRHTQKHTYQYDVNDAQNKQTRTEVFTMIIVIIKFQCKWLFV